VSSNPGELPQHDPREKPRSGLLFRRHPKEAQLSENPDWTRDLVEHSRDLLCVHDLEGRLLSVNPVPAHLLGYTVEEVLEVPMRELVDPKFRDQFDSYLQKIATSGEAIGILAILTRTGQRRFWEYHCTLRTEGVEKPVVRGIAHDVTERIEAEKALRESNQKLAETASGQEQLLRGLQLFRTLLDQSNDAIEVVDPATLRLLDVNEKACAELGYTRNELLSMTVFDIDAQLTPESAERTRGELHKSGIVMIESLHRRKDGSTFPVEVNLRRVQLDREYVVAISRDITERKRAASLLEESEKRFRAVHDRAPVGIAVVDSRTGKFLQVNPKYCEIVGRTEEAMLRLRFRDITHPADEDASVSRARRLFDEEIRDYDLEKRYVRPDGSVVWVNLSVVPMWRPGEPARFHMAIVQDITGRRRAEEELRKAKEKLTEEKLYLEQEIDTEYDSDNIIGESKLLKAVMESVGRVAPSDATVLLLGETGTGKELVARAIHRLSGRAGNPFIKMNCAAIPSGLLESELFGHEKGAFTGAVNKKIGRLELADRGTIFLDEIGEIPLALQPKLLRVLQDQEFERLGGTQTLKINFRLISATNCDLARSVREKEFRSDLFYRLHVFPILLPPLRERPEDIPLLVEHFVQKIARRMNKSITSIPKRTMDALVDWPWPGNVRELENFLERSLILTTGSVLTAPLSELRSVALDQAKAETLEAAERRHILKALRDTRGQISGPRGAANRLGLKRTTLQSKLKQLGINPHVLPLTQ
jgi:PAS domain S-box-containing protein